MKKLFKILTAFCLITILAGCSHALGHTMTNNTVKYELAASTDRGTGEVALLTPAIAADDTKLEFKTTGINEDKITFISVANQTILQQKIKNDETYLLDIRQLKAARQAGPQTLQLLQTKNDQADGEITMLKQVRYTVE